jgi:integrase
MPIKLYRRKGSDIYHYRGTVAGSRLRGSTRTANRETAARIASEVESRQHKRHLDGPKQVLTFPQAVALYLKAGKSERFIARLEDYWKDTRISDMTPGAIKQSAIDLYPTASGATRNRQVLTPTKAVINHCAELELCPPIRIKRFSFEQKLRRPITLEWLDTFCAHADRVNNALAVFMFATGCRISEARRLTWDDIDFQGMTILIQKTKNKRQRRAHIPQRLLVALANLSRDRGPFEYPETSMRRAWDRVIAAAAANSAGFQRLTYHSCRHGFATTLLHDGVDVVTVAKLGGWSSAAEVLKTYGHAKDDPTLTEGLFGTPLTQPKAKTNKINDL